MHDPACPGRRLLRVLRETRHLSHPPIQGEPLP